MASKKTRSRWAEDAALQALVRYGPEESGLRALAQQARADYGVAVRQAHGTAAGIVDATQRAIPEVRGIYDRAGLDQARTASLVSRDIAALGPAAGTLRAGAAMEVAQQLGNLRSARSAALEDLQTRQVAARQGEGFAVQAARRKYTGDIAKVLERSQGLARERGAFEASTIDALAQKAADRITRRDIAKLQSDTTRRGQTLSHQDRVASISQRREAAKQRAAQRAAAKLPGGAKIATPQQHGAARDKIDSIVAQIRPYADRKVSRHKVAQLFLQGAPADKTTGVQAIRAVPEAWLSVALDVAYDKHLSRRNVRELQRRGYSVRKLGLRGAAGTPRPGRPILQNPWTARVSARR